MKVLNKKIILTNTLQYMENNNLKLFHIYIASLLKLGIEKPVFNRFVVGKRVYQRNYLAVEFMANNSLFVSAYVTNVGSIGLDAPYHHMYEWGTTSLFSSLGQIHKDYIIEEEKIK